MWGPSFVESGVKHHNSSNEEYSIEQYVIKFVSDLPQVVGFLRALRFPPPIKLPVTIYLKYSWKNVWM